MKHSDFPDRIYVADVAAENVDFTELVYETNPQSVTGLPVRIYVPESEIDWERLARTKIHPLRISILEALGIDGGRTLSSNELALELQVRLGNASYHVKELFKAGLLELVETKQRRGASEHFYRLTSREPARDGG
ncbi:MAG TPA: helix-turn-helix domain-containing protein [Solirubrobacterales bacterium]|nr:helix-turn-helix domain-containing protein [Solirubrobacterales bacterium]